MRSSNLDKQTDRTIYFDYLRIHAIFSDGDMTRRLLILIKGRYHMWFIPMMVGLYISIPLLKPVASDKNLLKYYLALAFVFAFAIPQAITMVDDFATEPLITGVSALSIDLDNMGFYIVLGYTSYFILGYYLGKADYSL